MPLDARAAARRAECHSTGPRLRSLLSDPIVTMRTLTALLLIAAALPAQKRPITHEDVWLMKRAGAPAVSPDGKWAVTAVTEPSYDGHKTAPHLWIAPLDGSVPPRHLTNTLAPESGAVFSPDSRRLAFATKREGDDVTQIYVLPLDGGEAMGVTDLLAGTKLPAQQGFEGEFGDSGSSLGARWSPEGNSIVFIATTGLDRSVVV